MINPSELSALQDILLRLGHKDLTQRQLENIYVLIFNGPDAVLAVMAYTTYPKDIATSIDYLLEMMASEKLFTACEMVKYFDVKGAELIAKLKEYAAMSPEEQRTADTIFDLKMRSYRNSKN